MIQNVQVEIEQFDNGITLRWHDLDGEADDTSEVVTENEEAEAIGSEIWGDIRNIMESCDKNKVRLTIKYEPL